MENDFKTVTNAKGVEIPKYFKEFKKLVEKDRQLAEYLCMNYEDLDSEDLGAFLETMEQGFSWILELIESKNLLYSPQTGKKGNKKVTCGYFGDRSKRQDSGYRYFFYTLIIA